MAARERFAADGYERATIRAIAADAEIDPSMVMRYYGNKEKLFAAAAGPSTCAFPTWTGCRPARSASASRPISSTGGKATRR